MPREGEQPALFPDTADPGARSRARRSQLARVASAAPPPGIWARSPNSVLFEEREGLFWLRGNDLDRAKVLLGLRCDSPAVGFDLMTWSIHVAELAKKRVPMELLIEDTISRVRFRSAEGGSDIPSVPIDLSPVQLVGQREIDRLLAGRTKEPQVRQCLSTANRQCASGDLRDANDVSPLVAYQVDRDIYEVDWTLMALARSTVEALLVDAYAARELLRCQLVAPRSARPRTLQGGISLSPIKHRLAFGQLKLPL